MRLARAETREGALRFGGLAHPDEGLGPSEDREGPYGGVEPGIAAVDALGDPNALDRGLVPPPGREVSGEQLDV